LDDTAFQLQQVLSVKDHHQLSQLVISATNTTPDLAALIANSVAESYKTVLQELDDKNKERIARAIRDGAWPSWFVRKHLTPIPSRAAKVAILKPAIADPNSFILYRFSVFLTWSLATAVIAVLATWSIIWAKHRRVAE
jgi:hypothetical protein